MAHDPNYAGGSDEDEDAMEVDEEDDFGGEEYDYSDDDDLSWKVRFSFRFHLSLLFFYLFDIFLSSPSRLEFLLKFLLTSSGAPPSS